MSTETWIAPEVDNTEKIGDATHRYADAYITQLHLGASGDPFSFPESDGTASQILQTDGSGTVTWEDNDGATSLQDVVDDETPQLGGTLDVNAKTIQFPTTSITDVLDEDAMGTNSATMLATQQSIKAYADTKLGNVVEDTGPHLGGDLDVVTASIVSSLNRPMTFSPHGTGSMVWNLVDATGIGLDINSTVTTGDVFDITLPTLTSGKVIDINLGTALTSGKAIELYHNAGALATQPLLHITVDNPLASNTATGMEITQNGLAAAAIFHINNVPTGVAGFHVNCGASAQTADVAKIDSDNLTSGSLLDLVVRAGGEGFTNVNGAFQIQQLETVTGTGTAQWINMDGDGISLSFDSEATTADVINIDSAMTTGTIIDVNAEAILGGTIIDLDVSGDTIFTGDAIKIDLGTATTTGRGLWVYSNNINGAQTTDGVVFIELDNTGDTGHALTIQQDGTGDIIRCMDAATLAFGVHGDGDITLNTVKYTFPATDGTDKYVLQTDSSGGLTWVENVSVVATLNAITNVTIVGNTANELLQWSGSAWINQTISEIGLLTNIVDDETPQLGGSLDTQGNTILTVSDNNIYLTPDGTGVVRIQGTGTADVELEMNTDQSVANADFWKLVNYQSDNDFSIASKVSGSWVDKLKIATDGSQVITMTNTSTVGLDINSTVTDGSAIDLTLTTLTTGKALSIDAGTSITGIGRGLRVYTNAGSGATGGTLVHFQSDNTATANSWNVCEMTQDGPGAGLIVHVNKAVTAVAGFHVNCGASGQTGNVAKIDSDDLTTGALLTLFVADGGSGFTNTAGGALQVVQGDVAGPGNAVWIENLGTGAGLMLKDCYIELGTTLSTDVEVVGGTILDQTAGSTFAIYTGVFLNTDGKWDASDHDTTAQMAYGLAITAGTDTNSFKVAVPPGVLIRNDAWNWVTKGALLYGGEGTGVMTETIPSTAGDLVQIMGFVIDDDHAYIFINFATVEV